MLNPYDKYDKKTLKLIQDSGFRTEGSGLHQLFLKHSFKSYERAFKASQEENFDDEISESASSILFSVLACESVISEYITHFEFSSSEIPEELKKLRNEADSLFKWKKLLKYSDPEIQLNENMKYQKLSCLIKLRNSIAHRTARMLSPKSFPKELASCIRQRIIPEPREFRGSWLLTILNPGIAKWAYCAAKEWLEWSKDFVIVNEEDV